MALPCMVYRRDAREAVHHFGDLARACDLPIVIHDNPVSDRVDPLPEHFEELARVESIVAVEEASHDARRLGDRCGLFRGVDDLALENPLLGAVGWVSGMANGFPAGSVRLCAPAGSRRRALQRRFMPRLHLDTHVELVRMIELADQMMGLGAEWARAPRPTLEGGERAWVEGVVEAALRARPEMSRAA